MNKRLVTLLVLAVPVIAVTIPVSQALEAEFLCQNIPSLESHLNNQNLRSKIATSAFKIRFNDMYVGYGVNVRDVMVNRKIQLNVVCPNRPVK